MVSALEPEEEKEGAEPWGARAVVGTAAGSHQEETKRGQRRSCPHGVLLPELTVISGTMVKTPARMANHRCSSRTSAVLEF